MLKIIVADDVEDNRDFLFYVLSPYYDVIRCASGQELLASLPFVKPDLIVLDVSLPDMTGLEIVRRLRADRDHGHLPVVAVTAHAMAGDREKCLAAGFTDYVAKPVVDIDGFVGDIARLLTPRRSRAQS